MYQPYLEWLWQQKKDEYKSHQNYFQVDQNKQLLDEEDMQTLSSEYVALISTLLWQKLCTTEMNELAINEFQKEDFYLKETNNQKKDTQK